MGELNRNEIIVQVLVIFSNLFCLVGVRKEKILMIDKKQLGGRILFTISIVHILYHRHYYYYY